MKSVKPSDLLFVEEEEVSKEFIEEQILEETLNGLKAYGIKSRQSHTNNPELDDLYGKAVYEFDKRIRAGHKGKMANGNDIYRVVARHCSGSLKPKQLRRLGDRWKMIMSFRDAGLPCPKLTVTYYDQVKRIHSVKGRHEALQKAEENNWSVAKLRRYIDSLVKPRPYKLINRRNLLRNLDHSIKSLDKAVGLSADIELDADVIQKIEMVESRISQIKGICGSQQAI